MKALKRLFAGFACVLILGTMLAPVCAAGAEPLDWDAIVHNPDYRVYYDMIELGRSFTDDAYSGSAVSTLEASKEWDFAHPDAKQTVTFQVDFSRNSYLALRKRVKQYATQNIGIRDLTESSNDTINMGWDFQDLDDRNNFISYYHGNITFKMFIRFRSDGHMKLREKSGGYYDESYEDDLTYDEAINYKLKREHVLVSRGGTMQETELAGRTAFIENYNENGSRDTYIHVFDELSEIPGFWLEINFVLHESGSLDYQPEIMREDSPDLQRVISAHRDVRETILNEVIPDLAAAQISATWSDAEGSLAESNTQTETHDAETNPGEDNGTVIRNDIVETPESSDKTGSREEVSTAAKVAVSVGGALAAAGAMGASSGKRDGGEEEKRRKTYKMKVYKGFGDAIRRGDSAVTVWARIVEVVDGQETDRPDLSERITASGEGLTVQSAGMQNNWQGASVTVPAESEKEQGVLVFTFTGEGGVFRNRIVFRIIGEPKITFPDVSEDGTRWDMNTECSRVDMITGAGGRERLRFVITDTDQEPREIRFKGHEGFAITAEKDTKWQFTYYACIENRTKPMEKVNGIFATERPVRVTVEASFEDGRTIDNYFTIWLYPDGLSACTEEQFMHNDRLLINTVPKENVSEGYSKIAPTVFFLTLAYVDREGKVVVRENPGFDNEDPTDDGRYGLVFLENFEYHIKHWSSSGIAFYPETTLPYLGDPYEVRLPIAVEDEEGQKYQADLPLSVVGEGPRRIYGDDTREKELALLQKDMQIFGLDGNPELMGMVRAARRGNCSFEELRNLRFRLVEAAVNFYWEERGAEDRMSDLFTRYIVVAGTLVKAGDLAVEYVLKYYFVGYGYIVAKFSNPLKNMLCTYVGELSANGNLDQAPDFIKTVLKSSEEALSAAITGLFWGDDLKGSMDLKVILSKSTYMNITKPPVTEQIQETLGYVIAAYLLTCFARHYTYGKEGEKGDVYRSVIAAFQDLGLASLKAWFLDFVSKHCVSLFGKIGEACGKLYKQAVQKKLNEAAQEAGWKAFQGSVRKAFQSNPDELSRAALEAARQARSGASESLKKSVNETLDEGIRELSKAGEIFGAGVKDVSDSKSGGVLLTYLVSSMRDGKEVAGSDVKEVLYELVKEWLGVQANKIYEYVVPAETRDAISDVGLRVENGKIILTLLGYCVEINILENIAALTDLMFETLFSWMETLWEAMKTTLRWDDTPADLRDKVEKNPELIGQGLENTKQRIEANQWQYNGYERKTK